MRKLLVQQNCLQMGVLDENSAFIDILTGRDDNNEI